MQLICRQQQVLKQTAYFSTKITSNILPFIVFLNAGI